MLDRGIVTQDRPVVETHTTNKENAARWTRVILGRTTLEDGPTPAEGASDDE